MANEQQKTIELDPGLITAIAAAVAAAMKGSVPSLNMEELGSTIGSAVAQGIEKTTRRKVTYGEYMQLEGTSPFHKGSWANTPKLRRPCYQNGVWLNPTTLFDEEIELLNQITHSGRYIDRKVEVAVNQDGASEVLDIRFANATADQRLTLKESVKDFRDMLRQIVKDQKEERREQEEAEAMKKERRAFGNNKAFKDALAAAAAKENG